MPFDFQKYDQKCYGMNQEELQREWQHYTRLISGASTSTAVSGLALPLTAGVSVIGVGLAAPAIHNARKKREIIEKHLNRLGTTHNTRKRDVFSGVAVSGTIGVVTLGVGTAGADAIATAGADHGIAAIVENETAVKIVTHAALDGAGMGLEHMYTHHVKAKEAEKAFEKAGVFQAVADAKAREAGYAVQPYGTQPQAPYGNGYDQPMAPPPPYSSATAPPAFVPDTKPPAVTFAQYPFPGYHYQVPVPPQYSYEQQPQAYSSTVPKQEYTMPPTNGQSQFGAGFPAQPHVAPSQEFVQGQGRENQGLAYETPTVSTQPYNPSSVGHSYGIHVAQPPPSELGRDRLQSQEQGCPGQQPRHHAQQETASPPQTPAAPASHLPPQVATGSFDLSAMARSLPASTPAPRHQHHEDQHHQQQQQAALQQQQHQDQSPVVAVTTQPGSEGQPQAHFRSQSVLYQHPEYSTCPLAQPPAQGAVSYVAYAPAAPTSPRPYRTSLYEPPSSVTEYASQPTPTPQQHQKPPLPAPRPSYQDEVQQTPLQHPLQPDMQRHQQQAVPPPLLHQPVSHQHPPSLQEPTQLDVQQQKQQQYTVQAPQQHTQPYQASCATYPPLLEQQHTGATGNPEAVPPPPVSSTGVPPPPPLYHQPSSQSSATVFPTPVPSTGMPPPPPPPPLQPSALSLNASPTTGQRPASMIYFPPPPTTPAPKVKHAPPPPAQPVAAHRLSFPSPPPGTAPPSAIQGYAAPGVQYPPVPIPPAHQPLGQHQTRPPQTYQYPTCQPQQHPTPQPPPQQHSYAISQHPSYQPLQAAAQQQPSDPPHPQQQAILHQRPPPPPAQVTGYPPTPLSPPQSAQNTGQGYFTPQDRHQQHQQQHAGAQCPPDPQRWSVSAAVGQPQWPAAQAPYTPAATPGWSGY